MDKTSHPSPEAVANTPKNPWPLWRKSSLAAGIALLIVVGGLAVGLGVGLTRNKGGSHDESPSSDADDDPSPAAFNTTNLWQPSPETTWQIVLSNGIVPPSVGVALAPAVAVYDLDLYENEASTVAALRSRGVRVVCYFSAGSWEDYRDDRDDFPAADRGRVMDGWPHERWLNVSSPAVRDVMSRRIALAAEKGCDAIDPDNGDGYQNDNGLGLTASDAVSFITFLAAAAAAHNMSTGLKNAGDIVPRVLPYVAFSVNEQCVQYAECAAFAAFVDAGKPVFNIEYPDEAPDVGDARRADICSGSGSGTGTGDAEHAEHARGFNTVIKKMDLDGWVLYCDGEEDETEIKTTSSRPDS